MTDATAPIPYNDRLFLHLVRNAGALSKADLTTARHPSASKLVGVRSKWSAWALTTAFWSG